MTDKEINSMPKKFDSMGDYPTSRGEHITNFTYDRYLGLGESISLWKRVSLLIFSGLLISVGMNVYLSSRNTVVPYVVSITSSGEVLDIGKVSYVRQTPTDAQIVYFVNRAIKSLREVPYDLRDYVRNKELNKEFFVPSLYNKVYSTVNQNEIVELAKDKGTRLVELETFTKLADGTGYFVRWAEYTYDEVGYLRSKDGFESIIKIALVPSEDIDVLRINPLGIKITSMTTSKDNKLQK